MSWDHETYHGTSGFTVVMGEMVWRRRSNQELALTLYWRPWALESVVKLCYQCLISIALGTWCILVDTITTQVCFYFSTWRRSPMRWCTAMRTRWSIGTSSLRTSFLASVASWRSQTLAGRFTRRHWGELTTDQPKGLTLKNTIEGLGLVRLLFMKNSDVVHLHREGLAAMLWSWVKEEDCPKGGGEGRGAATTKANIRFASADV